MASSAPCSPRRTGPAARRRSRPRLPRRRASRSALMPAARAPSVNVPSPSFQSSASYPSVGRCSRRRHVDVGVAVEVEVGGDASAPSQWRSAPASALTSVNCPLDVAVERAPRQPASCLPRAHVRLRVRVDDEQVEPAVRVVVEPAEPAAHHRRRVARHSEAEGAVAGSATRPPARRPRARCRRACAGATRAATVETS